MSVHYKCDRCDTTTTSRRRDQWYVVSIEASYSMTAIKFDLCPDCFPIVKAFIKNEGENR